MSLNHRFFRPLAGCSCLLVSCFLALSSQAVAQSSCDPILESPSGPVRTYRLETRTVVEKVPVTRYREVKKTEMRTRQVVKRVPVRETSSRQVTETRLRPVTQTRYREEVSEKTVYDTTTEYREQQQLRYTTRSQTAYYDQTQVVQKPVTTTSMINETITTLKPVTTLEQQLVDRGGVENQLVYRPGMTSNRLGWVRSGYLADPVTGQMSYQRGGLRWIPQQNPGTYQVQSTYVPRYESQTVQRTTLQPQTQVVQRPVTTTQYVNETVTRKIPYTTQQVVPEVTVTRVPYTVRKPRVIREVKRIPYTETTYVEETATRTIPTETVTYRYETVNEQYPVEVTTLEPYTEYLEQQKVVSEWVPVGESAVSKKPALKMEKVDAADRPPVLSDQEARKAADEGAPVQKKVDQDSSDSGKASSGEPAKKE